MALMLYLGLATALAMSLPIYPSHMHGVTCAFAACCLVLTALLWQQPELFEEAAASYEAC